MADQETPEELRQRLLSDPVPLSARTPETGVRGTTEINEAAKQSAQQGFFPDLKDGFLYDTQIGAAGRRAAAAGIRATELTEGEGAVSWVSAAVGITHRGEEWDKAGNYESLVDGIPSSYHDHIMSSPDLFAATLARKNILNKLESQTRTNLQYSGVGNVIGTFVDIDLPLTFMPGATAIKTSRMIAKGLKTVPGARRLSNIAGAVAQNTIEGTKAGLIAGTAYSVTEPVSDWSDVAYSTIGGTILGGAVGPFGAGTFKKQMQVLKEDFEAQVSTDGPLMTAEPLDIEAEPAVGPVVFRYPDDERRPGVGAQRVNTDRSSEDFAAEVGAPNEQIKILDRELKNTKGWWKSDKTSKEIASSESIGDVNDFLNASGLGDAVKIGGGTAKVVLRSGDVIIRIGKANNLPVYGKSDHVLKPTSRSVYGDLYVELMEPVSTPTDMNALVEFHKKIEDEGLAWLDNSTGNVGVDANGNLRVIDGEVFPADKANRDLLSRSTEPGKAGRFWNDIEDDTAAIPDNPEPAPRTSGAWKPVPLKGIAGHASEEHSRMSENSQQWRRDSGFDRRKHEDDMATGLRGVGNWLANNKWVQIATGNWFATRMYQSASPTANWLAGTIIDSANGIAQGIATAARRQDVYASRIMGNLLHSRGIAINWARENGHSLANGWLGITSEGQRLFDRTVMLERNDRAFGRSRGETQNPDVRAQSDLYDAASLEAHRAATGKEGEIAIDGFDDIPADPHYQPLRWMGDQIMKIASDTQKFSKGVEQGLAAIKKGLAQSYRDAGISGKDVDAIADAVVTRAIAKDADVDTSVYGLLSSEGQEWLQGALLANGKMSKPEIDSLMKRLVGERSEGSKEGFAKRRNNVDMATRIETEDGSTVQIVDLLSQDLQGDWLRYSRGVAGSAALARHGITNRRQRGVLAETIQQEQRMAGEEPTPVNEILAILSAFDAGATKGYHALAGSDMTEVGQGVSLMRKLANLAYLGKLGLTQAGEAGMTIAHVGMENFYNRGVKTLFDKGMRENKEAFLKEIGFLSGVLGHDHKIFQDFRNLDDFSIDDAGWLGRINTMAANASQAQGYLSLFNQVRSWQQTTAATAVADKLFRTIKEHVDQRKAWDENFVQRARADLGLDLKELNELSQLVEDGIIEFDPEHGFTNKMNPDLWSVELQEAFGSGLMGNISQLVQKSMAGEQDAWMSTPVGALMTHLKTFPMAAVNKQLIRHMRSGNVDNVAIAAVLWSFGTATLAVAARSALNGTLEEDMKDDEILRKAFMYSNMTGWTTMYYDPLMIMLGLEGYAVNPYADRQGIMPPALSWAEDARRLGGAIAASVAGTASYKDKTAIKSLPFSNILLWSNVLGAIGKGDNFTTRNTARVQKARAKADKADKAESEPSRKWGDGTPGSETPPPGLTYEDIDGSISGSKWADGTPYLQPGQTDADYKATVAKNLAGNELTAGMDAVLSQ